MKYGFSENYSSQFLQIMSGRNARPNRTELK